MKRIAALLSLAGISVLCLLIAGRANANIISYTDPATFNSTLVSSYDETFDELSQNALKYRVFWDNTDNGELLSYLAADSGSTTSIVPAGYAGQSLVGNSASQPLTFTFNAVMGSQDISSFGGYFYVGANDSTTLKVTNINGDVSTLALNNSTGTGEWVFQAFSTTNTPGFATLEVTTGGQSAGTDLPQVDDFITGIGLVPEPAFFQLGALLALGALAVLGARRRQPLRLAYQI